MTTERCGGCPHAAHRGKCQRKGPSGCVPFGAEPGQGGVTGFICGARPPCSCAWRTCRCGAAVATTVMLAPGERLPPDETVMVWMPVVRGSAGKPDGRAAVHRLDFGLLASRELAEGEEPAPGEWRATEHTCIYEPAEVPV